MVLHSRTGIGGLAGFNSTQLISSHLISRGVSFVYCFFGTIWAFFGYEDGMRWNGMEFVDWVRGIVLGYTLLIIFELEMERTRKSGNGRIHRDGERKEVNRPNKSFISASSTHQQNRIIRVCEHGMMKYQPLPLLLFFFSPIWSRDSHWEGT
ncbi:hypothetical protein B0J11DRAFT_532733 [Dendryphion nanum]|uniref:Uncharacterized protein n=1 Tax=Dendryphion nanum TaxID=256645 RepID=A0A9P9IHI9_9PLEO|nr:hypothetical protein B0J11DRAFT_532733 [Dendryphion nanum]